MWAYLGEEWGRWDGGWHVSKLSIGVEPNGFCFQSLKHTSRESNAISGTVAVIH